MANTFLTPSIIAKEVAYQVHNNLVIAGRIYREFVDEYKKVGDTVTYHKPIRYVVNDGADITAQIQDSTENSDTIVVNKRKNVAMKYSSQEKTLDIKQYTEQHIVPAAIAIANQIDLDCLALYKDVYNSAGTVATSPKFQDLLNVGQKMTEFAVPVSGRDMVLNPAGENSLVFDLRNILQPSIVSGLIKEASIGRAAKFNIFGAQNVQTHTKGDWAGVPLVAGAGQTGLTLNVDGFNAAGQVLSQGDVITLAGVYAVNPITRQSTGSLQQFTLTSDITTVGAAPTTAALAISPSIITSGAYQTVTASPADNAVITIAATHPGNLAFVKEAFALVTVPLEVPESVVFKKVINYKGISVRLIQDYDVKLDVEILRLDVLYGVKTANPELACRVYG